MLRAGGRLVAFAASAAGFGPRSAISSRVWAQYCACRGFNMIKQMSESKAVIGEHAQPVEDHETMSRGSLRWASCWEWHDQACGGGRLQLNDAR